LIDEQGHAHLADYGLVFIIESSDFTSIKTAGTCRWTAPEIMNPPEEDPTEEEVDIDDELGASFTMSSDVYAFSMTVIEVSLGPSSMRTGRDMTSTTPILSL
jgi:serine/threonine protein kinase